MGLFILMKKFFVGLPIVITWLIIYLIAIGGFVWEVIDVGYFVPFAFITSILIPSTLEFILVVIFCKHITIDDAGIKKYFSIKKIVEYQWHEIKEIKLDSVWIYFSLEELSGDKNKWDKSKYIYVMYSDKLAKEIMKYKHDNIKIDLEIKE